MFSVVLKVASNIIGSQHKEFAIQKMNVAFDIISDHHGHICVPTHCIPHRRYQNQAKVVVVEWGEIILRKQQKQQKLLTVLHRYTQRPLFLRHQIQQTIGFVLQIIDSDCLVIMKRLYFIIHCRSSVRFSSA